MSRDCTQIVWDIDLKPATLKFTLLSLADRADNTGYRCYPSIDRISKDTGLNKKTVQQNIKKLCELGLIRDTGKRVGPTQKVRVLQINIKIAQKWNDTENGVLNDPKNGTLNDPENGLQNQSLEPVSEPKESDRSADQSLTLLVENGFQHIWKVWKETKKQIGKVDTSPKGETLKKKWKPMFNAAYWKTHTRQDFSDEINRMAEFIQEAHKLEGFNRFENMQLPKLLTERQWRDE